jgi:hypothetical protein
MRHTLPLRTGMPHHTHLTPVVSDLLLLLPLLLYCTATAAAVPPRSRPGGAL